MLTSLNLNKLLKKMLTSVTELHLGSKWQEDRERKKKKKGRERYLASHLGTTVPPAKKWGFPTLRMLAPAVFHIVLLLPSLPLPQNCLGPGGKVNEEKGEGDQMGDSFNLWALRVLFSAPQARTKGIFLCWGGGICLFLNAYFWT